MTDDVRGERAGEVIDRYKLQQEIGEGGMGTVWMAEQSEPVKRQVALKIIKLGMDTLEVVARFEAERQALAMMNHPHIAKVFDGGATATGRPFFVMELVKGVPITDYCDSARLRIRDRIELFAKVCDAIQHAHHKGIIHRDIKASNVMVTLHDGVPVPKVIDFGIAKAINVELTQKTLFTRYAQMIGTPEYMAPEQAEMSGLDIDTRADVYSLGVLLYELITGTVPFNVTEVLERGYAELLRTIREEEPARPSTRISALGDRASSVAAARSLDVHRLQRTVRGELDWLVMRALEKDRTRRYESAAGFAADVRRYLHGEPVHAAPPSAIYRLHKFVRRRARALVTAAVVAVLACTMAVFYGQNLRAAERQIADRSQRTSEAIDIGTMALGRAIAAPVASDDEWISAAAGLQRVTDLLAEGEVSAAVQSRADALAARVREARVERDLAVRLENVLITSASHPDVESWQRMEQELAQLFVEHGMELRTENAKQVAEQIRAHRLAERFVDILELWIATRAHIAQLGGPAATAANMQPWAEAIYVADTDRMRTGIRRILYERQRPTRQQVDALTVGYDLAELSPRTLSWLANTYSQAGAPEVGDRILRDAMRRHPTNVMLFFDYGYDLASQKRWHEAIRMYSRALAIRADAAGLWRMMGIALVQVDELDNAREAFSEAVDLEPDYGPTWIDLGQVLLQQERSAEALAAGRKVTGLMPNNPAGHGIAGRALMQKKDYGSALPLLEECDRLGQGNTRWLQPSGVWLAECRRVLEGK